MLINAFNLVHYIPISMAMKLHIMKSLVWTAANNQSETLTRLKNISKDSKDDSIQKDADRSPFQTVHSV